MSSGIPLYVLVAMLEPSPLRFETTKCALHVTVMPTFTLQADEEAVNRVARRVAAGIGPFTIAGGRAAMLGPDEDVRVRLVESDEIFAAHRAHVNELSGLISLTEPRYAGDGYLPHVTDQMDGRLGEGETKTVGSISLVRIEEPWAEIVDTYLLTSR
jgi:hypothetical protein